MGPTQLALLGRLQTPPLLLCSLRAIRFCSTKEKKAFSTCMLGAWLTPLWRVKGTQLASLTWMIELPSFCEAYSLHTGRMNEEGVSIGRVLARKQVTRPLLQIPEQEPSKPTSHSSSTAVSLN